MANSLTFYFDVVCPYAYLASTQVERIARDAGAALTFRPMLLGGIFQALKVNPSVQIPQKARNNLIEMHRWAAHWGVAFQYPAEHPRRTVDAMRLCAAASLAGDPAPVAHDLFRAYWVDGNNVADPALLAEIAARHGLAADAFSRDESKAELRAVTDEALAAG